MATKQKAQIRPAAGILMTAHLRGENAYELNFREQTRCGVWAPMHLIRAKADTPCGMELLGHAVLCAECAKGDARG